jgi:apolipoprotein N-acyltransferase
LRRRLATIAVRLALAFAGTALFCGYAVAPALAFLPYLAVVPWVILYTDPKRPRASSLYFLLVGYVCWVICYRMTARFGWFVPPAMAVFFTPAWILFPLIMKPVHRLELPRSVSLPIVWVAVEWARVLLATGHFDLFTLGYSQARFVPLVQVADVTGVYGLSFLVAAVNGWLADLWFALREESWRFRLAWRRRRVRAGALSITAVFTVVVLYGYVRLATFSVTEGPRLAVVQPNGARTPRNVLGTSLLQLFQTDEAVADGSADLIVWPENAILDDIDRKGAFRDDLAWLAARKRSWILLGAQGWADKTPGRTTNSAFLLDETGTTRGRYDKQILFPFAEYVPLDGAAGAVAPPVQRAYRALIRKTWGSLPTATRGTRMTLFELPFRGGALPFAVLLGVENTYPPLVADAGRRGARFFVNITSGGEAGGAIQEQLLRVSILRAVENRAAYVSAGTRGISGFIDPQGRVSPSGEVAAPVALPPAGTTLYATSRDGFALLCVAAALLLLARALRRGGPTTMTPIPAHAATAASLIAGMVALFGCSSHDDAFAARCPDEAACREALAGAADRFRTEGSAEAAVVFFNRVSGAYPPLAADARPYRAFFLDRSGETRAAIAEYRAALKDAPQPRTYVLLGTIHERTGDPAEALAAYQAAQSLARGDAHLTFLVARALWETGDAAGASRTLAPLLEPLASDPSVWTLAGQLELEAGRPAAAIDAFTRAAADRNALNCRYQLARLAWREGRKDEARRWLRELRAIEAAPGQGTAD